MTKGLKRSDDVELLEGLPAGTRQAVHRFPKTRAALDLTTNTSVSPPGGRRPTRQRDAMEGPHLADDPFV